MIRIVLLGCFFLVLTSYFKSFRSVAVDRLIAIFLFAFVSLAIIFPDSTTIIAHKLGVGRGTDLILYLYIVGSFFAVMLLYSRSLQQEQKLTQLVREIALLTAKK